MDDIECIHYTSGKELHGKKARMVDNKMSRKEGHTKVIISERINRHRDERAYP